VNCALLIQQAHQRQIVGTLARRLIVEGGSIQAQQFTLAPNAERRVIRLHQLPLGLN